MPTVCLKMFLSVLLALSAPSSVYAQSSLAQSLRQDEALQDAAIIAVRSALGARQQTARRASRCIHCRGPDVYRYLPWNAQCEHAREYSETLSSCQGGTTRAEAARYHRGIGLDSRDALKSGFFGRRCTHRPCPQIKLIAFTNNIDRNNLFSL